jgi:hypothetical protein
VEVIRRLWLAFAEAVGDFIEEAAFRLELCYRVLAGKLPLRAERRWWNRSIETPVSVDVRDWTDDRLIFTDLVWPALEAPADEALEHHDERVKDVLRVISDGAADKVWSMRYEIDDNLRWDHERQVWAGGDGFAYSRSSGGRGEGFS